MKYAIIDTSSILFGFTYGRNVFESAMETFEGSKLLVSRGIITELTRFSSNKGAKGMRAKVALMEIKAKKISVDNISTNVDKWILYTAPRKGALVITNDTPLAKRLVFGGIKVFKMSRSGVLRKFSI